jgi:hypothetical protein
MGKLINTIIPLFILLCSSSCGGDKVLTQEDYVDWYNTAKDVNKQKEVGEYNIELKYLTHDYLALRHFKNAVSEIDKEAFDKQKKRYEGHYYFTLRIKNKDNQKTVLNNEISGYGEYGNRLNYFAFYAQDDFKLIEGKDTVECALHHFENNYGLSPINDITIVFKDKKLYEDMTFVWFDRVLGVGTVKFFIEKSELDNLPKLDI